MPHKLWFGQVETHRKSQPNRSHTLFSLLNLTPSSSLSLSQNPLSLSPSPSITAHLCLLYPSLSQIRRLHHGRQKSEWFGLNEAHLWGNQLLAGKWEMIVLGHFFFFSFDFNFFFFNSDFNFLHVLSLFIFYFFCSAFIFSKSPLW